MQYGFVKTDAGDEKIDPQRRDGGPDLEIRKEDDPEVNRVDPISESDGTDEGDDDGQCREHPHDATHSEEKEIHDHQEKEGAADMGLEEIQHLHGDFIINQTVC